jgi:hypothetical protein
MRHFAKLLTALVAVALATVFGASAAQASNIGQQTDNGYAAKVEVHLSGDVSQSLVGSVPGPPPMCWWENLSSTMLDSDKVDTDDPKAVQDYYDTKVRPYLTGHAAMGQLAMPSEDYFKDIIKRSAKGEDLTFYALQVRDGAVSGKPGDDSYAADTKTVAKACGTPTTDSPYGPVLMSWQAFPTGQEPAPAVSPEDLAAYAYEVMDLKKPTLEWNPHLASDADASLVNLPTWLWTRDPAAVEQRQVTAEAAGISVTVTAEPSGMTVSTPVGGTDCSADQARTAYAPGVDEGSACVFTFPKSSVGYDGGFPVQATTGWQATWTSNSGPGGDLDPKTMTATTDIPVIEVQSRVDSVS